MASQNVGATVLLQIDGTGTSETRPAAFPFANDPVLAAGDTLSSSLPNVSFKGPTGQGNYPLVFGTPVLSGTTWTVPVVATQNSRPGWSYSCTCRALTNDGFVITSELTVVLEGIGFSPQGSPAPTLGGATGTFSSSTGILQSIIFANGWAQNTLEYGQVTTAQMVPTGIGAGTLGDASHIPVYQMGVDGRAIHFTNTPMIVIDQGGQAWNAFADKYGLVGDGHTDDWAGLQQWINDGITSGKKLIMPPPPVTCLFSQPLVFNLGNTYNTGLGTNLVGLWLEFQPGYNATGGGYALTYSGGSNTSALQFLGIQNGVIKGLTLNIGGGAPTVHSVVGLDFLCSNTLPNFANLHLEDINILFLGTGTNKIGFRFGQSQNGQSNISGTYMANCSVTDSGSQYGSIGCQLGGGEVLPFTAINCKFSFLGAAWLVGSIQSQTVTPLPITVNGIADYTILPLQTNLLFPPSGTVQLASSINVTYGGKDTSTLSVSDASFSTSGQTITSASTTFINNDVGALITGDGIPFGTTIQSITSAHVVSISQTPTQTLSNASISWTRNVLTGCTGIPTENNPQVTVQQYVTQPTNTYNTTIAPQGVYYGGGDNTWIGCSGGGNHWDYYFTANTNYRIFGGRWEGHSAYLGNHFLQVVTVQSPLAFNVEVRGITLAGYVEPSDYPGVFVLNGAVGLLVANSTMTASTLFDSNFIYAGNSWFYTSITFQNCSIAATTPFWTTHVNTGTALSFKNVQLTNTSALPQSILNMETIGGMVAPQITAGVGAGTSPTISVSGVDQAGTITLTTGATPQPSAAVFTVTFNNAFPTTPKCVILTPAEAVNTPGATVSEDATSRTAGSFTVKSGAALPASTSYKWNYRVTG